MNPTEKSSNVAAKIVLLLALACIVSIFLINGVLPIGVAQSQQREFDNQVPKHLPFKVKIKKEKENAVKDGNNEKWMHDFELEVTNTGDKPIYYLSLFVDLPGITIPGGTDGMGFPLHFGRRELHDIETKANPDDVAIKPGETYVFSLSANKAQSWERFMQREHKPAVKKLILLFQLLSFGDGTGFVGNQGLAVPHPPDTKSSLDRCAPMPSFNDLSAVIQKVSWRSKPATHSTSHLPADSLLVNFLSLDTSMRTPVKAAPQSGLCCAEGCYRSKPDTRDCACSCAS